MGNRWQALLNPSPPPFPFQLSPSLSNFYPFLSSSVSYSIGFKKTNKASCITSIKWSQINTTTAFAGLMPSSEVTEREAFVGKLPSDWCGDPTGGEGLTTASDGHNTFSPVLIKIAGLVYLPVLCAVRLTVSRIIMLASRSPPDTVSCRWLSLWLIGDWKYSAVKLCSDVMLSMFFIRVKGCGERRKK